ncbi:hypothetical protein LZC95_22625 [Pendulispora brunnea]|uniref:Mannosyltransferase n=1 Tax=Pendulispora brunnea TaxID=2905690 RepID=A0ABZ2KLR7_9BACT
MTTHATPQASAVPKSGLDAADLGASARSSSPAAEPAARSRWSWMGLGFVGALGILVFWAFDALPFQDLPAHAGLIALRHRFAESPFDQRFFVLAPHLGPYSLFRFIGEQVTSMFGPIAAVRTLGTLPLVVTPAALLFARRRLHGDMSPTMGFMGIVLSFGLMTLLGFASYLLGLAVMLFGLTLWLELLLAADRGENTIAKELVMLAAAPLIFIAHGHAFILFLVLAGIATIVTGRRRQRLLRLRTLVPALSLAAYVAWLERASTTPPGSVHVSAASLEPHFQGPYDKFTLLITPTLMTRTGIDFVIGCVVWLLVILCTVATVRKLSKPDAAAFATEGDGSSIHTRALVAGAVVIGAMFLVLPHAIGWFGFVDGRLVPLVLFLCLMAIRRPSLDRWLASSLDRMAPALAYGVAVVALVASYRFQNEARGYHEILAAVPSEARVLNVPLDPNSDIFTAHPFTHYDKLLLAERPTVVSDIWFHQGSALYPTKENPALRLPSTYSESDLHGVDWAAYHLEDWDYVLIRTRPEASTPATPDRLSLAEHRGGWWLYKSL